MSTYNQGGNNFFVVFVFTVGGKGRLSNVKNGFGLFYIIHSLRSETSNHRWILTFHSNPISYAKLLSISKYHLEGSNSLPYLLCHRRWPPSLLNSGDLLEVASQFLPSYHPTSTRESKWSFQNVHQILPCYQVPLCHGVPDCDLRPSSLFRFLAQPCRPRSFPHSRTGPSSLSPPPVPTQHAPSDRRLLWVNPPSLRLASKSPFAGAPRTSLLFYELLCYNFGESEAHQNAVIVRPRREAEPITAGLHPRTRPWQTLDKQGRRESQVSSGKSLVSSRRPTRPAMWRQEYSPSRPRPSRKIFPTETKPSTSGRSAAAALLPRPTRPCSVISGRGRRKVLSYLLRQSVSPAWVASADPKGSRGSVRDFLWEWRRGFSGRARSLSAGLRPLGLERDILFRPTRRKLMAPMSSTYVSAARDSAVLFRGKQDSVFSCSGRGPLGQDLLEPKALGHLPRVLERGVSTTSSPSRLPGLPSLSVSASERGGHPLNGCFSSMLFFHVCYAWGLI